MSGTGQWPTLLQWNMSTIITELKRITQKGAWSIVTLQFISSYAIWQRTLLLRPKWNYVTTFQNISLSICPLAFMFLHKSGCVFDLFIRSSRVPHRSLRLQDCLENSTFLVVIQAWERVKIQLADPQSWQSESMGQTQILVQWMTSLQP